MRTLDYFTKSDGADVVSVGITSDGLTGVVHTSDATLSSRAQAAGRSTWDENDLCAELNLQRKPAPEPAAAEEGATA